MSFKKQTNLKISFSKHPLTAQRGRFMKRNITADWQKNKFYWLTVARAAGVCVFFTTFFGKIMGCNRHRCMLRRRDAAMPNSLPEGLQVACFVLYVMQIYAKRPSLHISSHSSSLPLDNIPIHFNTICAPSDVCTLHCIPIRDRQGFQLMSDGLSDMCGSPCS